MPVYKFTIVFSGNNQGWTESYYYSQPNPLPLAQLYAGPGLGLLQYRQAILANNCSIDYLRIGTVGTKFAVQLFPYNLLGLYGTGVYGAGGVNDVNSNLALLIRCQPAVAGPNKNIFMRGVPYTILKAGEFSPPATFQKPLNVFLGYLIGTSSQFQTWGWWGVTQGSAVTCPVVTYALATQAPNQYQVTITFAANPAGNSIFQNVPVGTKVLVRLTGINGKSELNGVQVVTVLSPLTCLTKEQFGVVPFSHGGNGTYNLYGFIGIGAAGAEKLVTRKAGMPLFLERGRAKNRTRT